MIFFKIPYGYNNLTYHFNRFNIIAIPTNFID